MDEEFVKKFQSFDLSAKEGECINLEASDICNREAKCRMSLVGRIHGLRAANLTGVKNVMNHVWGWPEKLKVVELGNNKFQFFFQQRRGYREGDKRASMDL